MFIRQFQKSVLVGNLERKVEYIWMYLILHDLKDTAITGDKNCFYKSTKGNRIGWQGSFGKCRFPADSEHWCCHGGAFPKNRHCVEIKALWIHNVHFHMGKPFQRKHRKFPLVGWERIPSTDHQSSVGVKLWRQKTSLKYYFLPYLITK